MVQRVTRLAPSPTGALHLGNARTFLVNYAIARQQSMRIVLRIEDLDTPRVKAGANEQAMEDLAWLGMTWDAGPFYQANDLAPYRDALAALDAKGLIYPCACTRSEILAAQSAPHGDEHELRYPGTCRPGGDLSPESKVLSQGGVLSPESKVLSQRPVTQDPRPGTQDPGLRTQDSGPRTQDSALRVIIPDEAITFTDMIAGTRTVNVQRHVGDFLVATKAGLPAYQLAVVVDDARQGVTDVVRGDDLITSAARQMWLCRFLDLTPSPGSPGPTYWHVPLVIGEDGRRLAKRHGDTRIAWCRERGVKSERIIGLIASWSGVCAEPRPMSMKEWIEGFDVAKLPHEPVAFAARDQRWLLDGM